MKAHILSHYASNSSSCFFSEKKTLETFSIENTDNDNLFLLKTTNPNSDSTETIENTDILETCLRKGTVLTKSIENSDHDDIYLMNKTKLTESIENSDYNEFLSNL